MAELSIANVINVTLVPTVAGLAEFNTANIMLLSTDQPLDATFSEDEYRAYKMASEVASDFGVSSLTYKMSLAIFSQSPNILSNSGTLYIGRLGATESQVEAFNRLQSKVLFCGFMTTDTIANDLAAIEEGSSSSIEEATLSSVINAENNKIHFVVSNNTVDIDGIFTDIKNLGFRKTRCLYYGVSEEKAKIAMAAAASRGMSTVFEGSLTTQTMNLKTLVGVEPDSTMTQTLLGKCETAGVDCYVSFEGVPSYYSTGANGFFDEVFNELWFVNAIQVAGFNALKQTNTKIPQTENGMDILKSYYNGVCVRAVNNNFVAPGEWTLPDTFGNPDLFKMNIRNLGYYIYSQPVAQQAKADREARKAPLVQIAIKTAGAVHFANILINVNL